MVKAWEDAMTKDIKDILEDALRLPAEARAAMAGSLLESLDREVDEDAEGAWRVELESRLRELDSGAVRPAPWPEARKRIMED
jgi:putative addiction module component (TIGR02574 family)